MLQELLGGWTMAQNNSYNDESIRQLKGAERVRKRPGVMFGSDDIKGAFHTFKEILGNSLDEARDGYGSLIEVVYKEDGGISVRDYGRGVPMGWNKAEGRYNWELVFDELYAGGKYDDDGDNYKFSVGLNGLGAAAVQYTSEYFNVISYQEKKVFKKDFKKGYPTNKDLVEEDNKTGQTGTFIEWKVDNEVFPDTAFTFDMFKEYCEGQAHINAVNFKLLDEHTGEEVEYEGKGVEHYLREQLGDKVIDIISKKAESQGIERTKKYSCKCEIVLAVTSETKSKQLFFHNTANMSTGVHIDAVQDAVNGFFKQLGKKNGVTIMPYDYNDYLSVIVSTYSNITSFANQTKDGVSNQFVYFLIKKTVEDILNEAVIMGKDSINTLIQNVVNAALARKKAKEIEIQARQVSKMANARKEPEKLVSCREKDPRKRELFIVEGDSAMTSCKLARDGSFQAIIPVRGKTLNCLKASMESILESQIINDLISAIGTGVDIGGGKELFDIDKLKYNKIIICTDADVDGFQIRVLLYTTFYRLMPQLLRDGYIFVAETPLFEIETSAGIKFAYTIEEKDAIMQECEKNHITVRKVNRSKGLGENDPDMLWNTTMNPETRKLVPLEVDINESMVRDLSNMLFGNDPGNGRKEFIFDMLGTGLQDFDNVDDLMTTVNALVPDELVVE